MVDCHFIFMNKTAHEQVATFHAISMNIFSNYIPKKYIIIDDNLKNLYVRQKISLNYIIS